jgi:DNA ligase (NAD+)
MDKIEEFKNKIIKANELYRVGSPIMTDLEYDTLLEQYRDLVPVEEYNTFICTLHEKTGKIKLPYILGSLNKLKCQEPDTIIKFISKYAHDKLHVSAKIDGISACIVYKDGKLVHAATRGNGEFGESLDDKITFVKGIILELPEKLNVTIRGELVILKSDFENMDGSNPRNVCAGIMNRKVTSKEWNQNDLNKITFIPYTILGDEYTKEEQFKLLKSFGFQTAWNIIIDDSAYKILQKDKYGFADLLFKYATQELPYEIDGIVISNPSYKNENKYYPDAQVAVKTNTMSAETTLIDINWEGPSKNGIMFPVAVLEPISLGGAIISKATLNNLDYISNLNLKYGCKVKISKRGDIIPAVDSVISIPEYAKDIQLPNNCSCCGAELIRDGVHLRCMNKECRTQKIYQIEHFIKKMGVANASYKTLDNFGIDSYEKLLSFKANPKKLSEKKFIDELKNKIFNKSSIEIFTSLDIKDVGETLQQKIIDFYGWDNIKNPNFNFNCGLPTGIGEITLNKFKEAYIQNLYITNLFINDIRYSWTENLNKSIKTTNIKGSICFTGALSISRNDATKFAIDAGFEVKNSVTKGLTYLVTSDPNSGSSKNEKAKKYGTSVIDEKTFMNLIKNSEDTIMDF